MTERDKRDGAWFAPKSYGFGTGLPIAWQGWAVLGIYVLVILASGFLIERSLAAYAVIVGTATLLLLLVCARTTRGGWRWRRGKATEVRANDPRGAGVRKGGRR